VAQADPPSSPGCSVPAAPTRIAQGGELVTRAERRIRRRRKRVLALREEGLTIGAIAQKVGVARATVHSDIVTGLEPKAPVPGIQTPEGKPVAGAEPGNSRAVTHGARSELQLAPVRERHVAELHRQYPKLDGRRLVLLADRLARIEVATAWLDQRDGVVRNKDGEVFAVVGEVERWSSRAEKVIAEVEAEHRRDRRFDHLGGYLESDEHDQGDGDGDG
jgi:hypothetical protein